MNRTILTILLFVLTIRTSAQTGTRATAPIAGPTAPTEEKIYVHTDKEFYLAGEIMWFKAYTVDATSHIPLSLSKIAYVEILSKEQRPVAQAKIALAGGLGNGSFQLPFSVRSGNYILRAYTNWMKNTGPGCFFEKNLTILNTLRDAGLLDSLMRAPADPATPAQPAPAQSSPYDIQFFPEGGNLIAGLPGRIAFRIVDHSGTPLACKGTVVNPSGDTITRCQTLRFGMGSFMLTPEENTKYRAVLELEDHHLLVSELPMPEKTGYTMQVTDPGAGQLKVLVRTNIRNDNTNIKLYISSRQAAEKELTAEQNISNGETSFTIEKSSLTAGISRLTLLTGNNTPVSERLWFKAPTLLKLDIRPGQEMYGTREKAGISLSCSDTAGGPVRLNGSMAVILLDSLQSINEDDLLSYLYLSSDLKGPITSPDYYFSGNTPEIQETADLLMMTQGWRRFRPSASQPPTSQSSTPQPDGSSFPPEYIGMLVTGRITDRQTGQPVANIPAWLCAPGNYFHLAYSASDKNGMIQWDLGLLYGEHELVVEPVQPGSNNRYRIDILSSFSETPSQYTPSDLRLPHSGQLLGHSIGAQAQNAWQVDRRQHFSQPPISDTTPFYGQPGKRYLLDDYTRFSTMEEVMREYAKETRVRNRNGDFSIFMQSDQTNQFFFDTPPLVLMDGMPVPDFNNIIRFDPLKIRKMEVVPKRYFLGDTLYNGILSYGTYQGDLAGFPLDSSAYIQEYQGLQAQRDFYSPVYETTDQQKSRIPDLRNVLFWDPAILTDSQGSQSLSFYTSDWPGRYAIIIQGITADGRVGKGVAAFSVQSIGKK